MIALIFTLAALSCLIGATASIYCGYKRREVFEMRAMGAVVLSYVGGLYFIAALANWGLIEMPYLLRSGTLTALGVMLLSSLVTANIIAGWKKHHGC